MKKRVFLLLIFSLLVYSKNVYAILDPMATLQSGLKLKQTIENQIQEAVKIIQDAEKTVRQGFAMATNCFANPLKCYDEVSNFAKDTKTKIDGIRTVGGELQSGDLMKKDAEKLAESIKEDGTYKKGTGDDISRRDQLKQENNAIVIDNIAILFAKGMVTKQNLMQEDTELYNRDFENDNMDELIFAQGTLLRNSDARIARILELRSYMFQAQAVKELMQYNRENEEEE